LTRNRGWLLAATSALSLLAVRPAGAATADDLARWSKTAAEVVITRDDWGIAHVHGRTDADAVFGMIYAQAEDDFDRVEANYLTSLGRRAEAEAEGEAAIWTDLRQRLYVDDDDLKARYRQCPEWLRRLMDAWADGLNYYLATHPQVTPRAIARFEPWMALSFSEGSIGGDIERVSPEALAAFYGQTSALAAKVGPVWRQGSAPAEKASGLAAASPGPSPCSRSRPAQTASRSRPATAPTAMRCC
jgi:acyl-homoserine-lactone acylase